MSSYFSFTYRINCMKNENFRLRDIREDHDLTQTAVADFLHVRQSAYSQYETGQRQLPLSALMQLALLFQTSTDYILGLTDDPKPYPRSRRLMEKYR